MSTTPAGIAEADWLATPAAVRDFILAEQQEIEQLRSQLTALATELAGLREKIGRSSRNSSKPPSSDGPGYRCAEDARIDVNPPGRPTCRCREGAAAGSSSAKQPARNWGAGGLLGGSLGF